MIKNRAVALGVVGSLVVVGGIIMSVLIHLMVDVVNEGYRTGKDDDSWEAMKESSNSPVWVFGMVFIVPGVLLFIAALVQNKCMYITSSIFALIALLVMGLFFIIAGLSLFILIVAIGVISDNCEDTPDGCVCRNEDNTYDDEHSPFKTCEYFSTFATLLTALFAFIIVTWILLLVGFILAIYYSCKPNEISQPGTVYAPVQQPMYAIGQDPGQYPPPGYTYKDQGPAQPMYLEGGSQPYYDGPPSKV